MSVCCRMVNCVIIPHQQTTAIHSKKEKPHKHYAEHKRVQVVREIYMNFQTVKLICTFRSQDSGYPLKGVVTGGVTKRASGMLPMVLLFWYWWRWCVHILKIIPAVLICIFLCIFYKSMNVSNNNDNEDCESKSKWTQTLVEVPEIAFWMIRYPSG